MWEEMRCSIEYSEWRANWWSLQSERREDASPQLKEGLAAYAIAHADIERALATRFRHKWDKVQARALTFLETTHLRGISKLYSTPSTLAPESLAEDPEDFTVELDMDDVLEDEDEYD